MSRKYLGLDLQEDALCAVLMESALKNRSMDWCIRIPLSDSGSSQDRLDQAFNILNEKISLEGCTSALCVPIDKVTCRNMRVPFTDTKKIRQVLPFELEPLLPFPVEDLVIDFQKINTTPDGANILTIVAQVSALKPFLDTAGAYHLDPETLVPGAYATSLRLATDPDMPENWLLLDMHPERCGLLAVSDRKICLMRAFPVSLSSSDQAPAICRQIQQTMAGIDSLLETDDVQTSFLPAFILMTGPGADGDTLSSRISKILELPVNVLDLFEKYGLDKKGTLTAGLFPHQLNNALACALLAAEGSRGGLNLRQGALAPKSRFFEYKQTMLRTGIMAAIAILLAFSNLMAEIMILEKEATRLNQQVIALFKSVLPDTLTIVEPVHQLQVEMEELKKKTFATAETSSYLPAIDILFNLSQDIPASLDVRFAKLVVGDQSILISGTTDSFNSVNDMKGRLEKNSLFKIVKINSADMEQTEKRVRFKIQIQL
ncbi:MAG: type II secretion system protein GspL [Pseudomonadota bacterium]